jgi:hypothetical protein
LLGADFHAARAGAGEAGMALMSAKTGKVQPPQLLAGGSLPEFPWEFRMY